MNKFYQITLALSLILVGMSCTTTYQLTPSSIPTPTPTPAIFVCASTPTPGPPPNGIYWSSAQVEGITVNNGVTQVDGVYANLLLSVNGAAESTATVSLNGPGGLSSALSYTGPVTQNGNIFAQYQVLLPNTYLPGSSYSLKTITSAGSAAATITGPGNIPIASDGSVASWTMAGNQNTLVIGGDPFAVGGSAIGSASPPYPLGVIYRTGACASETSPFNIPASDYSSSGVYTVTVQCRNITNSITGGTGNFWVLQNDMRMMNKITVPTPTPVPCNYGGPTCTPTVVGAPVTDTISLSPRPYPPASGLVNISATFPYVSGQAQLAMFDTFGPISKMLLVTSLNTGCNNVLIGAWDGTDSTGAPVQDGVYVLAFMKPDNWLLQLLLVVR